MNNGHQAWNVLYRSITDRRRRGNLPTGPGPGTTASSGSEGQGAIALFDPLSRSGGHQEQFDTGQAAYLCLYLRLSSDQMDQHALQQQKNDGGSKFRPTASGPPGSGFNGGPNAWRAEMFGLGAQGDVLSTNTQGTGHSCHSAIRREGHPSSTIFISLNRADVIEIHRQTL